MKRFTTSLLTLLLASTLLAGCGTIFSGTSDDISFNSQPAGADIMVGGAKRGTTPATISVSRDALNDKVVTLKKDGYEDRRIKLQKDFTLVSIFNGPNLLWWGVDVFTGALMNYSKRDYNVELDQGASSYRLEELPKNENGTYVVPDHNEETITVSEPESGMEIVISNN